MALASLTDVKTHLGISGTTYDTQLTFWLNAALSAVINYCGTSFETATRTEYYSPDGYIIRLRNGPVQSVTSVYEDASAAWNQNPDGAFGSDTLLVAGQDYALVEDQGETTLARDFVSRSCLLRRLGKPWARRYPQSRTIGFLNYQLSIPDLPAIGAVKVVYISGYSTVPAAITQAVCWEVDAYRQRAGHSGGMMTQESLGEYSYQLANIQNDLKGGLLSDAAKILLAPFKNLGGGLVI